MARLSITPDSLLFYYGYATVETVMPRDGGYDVEATLVQQEGQVEIRPRAGRLPHRARRRRARHPAERARRERALGLGALSVERPLRDSGCTCTLPVTARARREPWPMKADPNPVADLGPQVLATNTPADRPLASVLSFHTQRRQPSSASPFASEQPDDRVHISERSDRRRPADEAPPPAQRATVTVRDAVVVPSLTRTR